MKGNLCNQSFLFKSAPSAFFSCCILHNVRLTALLKMKGKQTQASLQKYRFYVYIIFESIDETSSDERKFLLPFSRLPKQNHLEINAYVDCPLSMVILSWFADGKTHWSWTKIGRANAIANGMRRKSFSIMPNDECPWELPKFLITFVVRAEK